MSIQSQIQAKQTSLAPSMQRVAQVILSDPHVVLEGTISELARRSDTSETTIVRFCRVLGLQGYVQLRLALATEMGREDARRLDTSFHGADLTGAGAQEASLESLIATIGFTESLGIEETIANLDLQVLKQVVTAIDGADRISTYGVSASGWSAADLQRKLFRIGRNASHFTDGHEAVLSTALMNEGDVAIGFSHRGTTNEVIGFLAAARERGATTVALTNSAGSPLAQGADLALSTSVRESQFRAGPMASRTAQLVLVDCIFVGVAQHRLDESVAALRDTYDTVTQYQES